MALNCPIINNLPQRLHNQMLILRRDDIRFDGKIQEVGKVYGAGSVSLLYQIYLTTHRIVFVNQKHQKQNFKSFDIPLAYIFNQKFQQPIFGANYLALSVKPLLNLLPADSSIQIHFYSGGCGTFLKFLNQLIKNVRKNKGNPSEQFNKQYAMNLNSNTAYIDPSDPSVILMS